MASFSMLILLSCLLIHIQLLNSNNWIDMSIPYYVPLILSLSKGISYLSYPLCGWIADVKLSNFQMIKWSFILVFVSSFSMLISGLWSIVSNDMVNDLYIAVSGVVFILTGLIGSGMYEANAIQFGMDQMIGSSSEQLSSFIHWYFWCVNVGALIIFYCLVSGGLCFNSCVFGKAGAQVGINDFFSWTAILLSCTQLLATFCGMLFILLAKRCFNIQHTTKNPLKIIIKVLTYSFKHKYPERRSAFTYWENYIPSRIDLGKAKYGGPFTYEQVEDVKAMFRLLLLMVSLFGYHLSGDGFSLTFYIMNTMGCPSTGPSIALTTNPQHIIILVIVLGIPIYQFVRKYISHYTPSLLNRIWWGLFFCLASECIQCNFSLLLQAKQFDCPQQHSWEEPSLMLKCIVANMKVVNNDSCEYFCFTPPVSEKIVYLTAIPLVLNGLSYLLVFVTTVEFICAQSPNAMKGFLIGVWYSMLSVKYIVIYSLDHYTFLLKENNWNIYHGIKGLCIFLSIVSFSVICKHYHYRERDEIVNEQAMIEEQYERELLLNVSSVSDYCSSDN